MVTRPKVRWPFQIGRIARLLWHPRCLMANDCPHIIPRRLPDGVGCGGRPWAGRSGRVRAIRQPPTLILEVQISPVPANTMPGTKKAPNPHRSTVRPYRGGERTPASPSAAFHSPVYVAVCRDETRSINNG